MHISYLAHPMFIHGVQSPHVVVQILAIMSNSSTAISSALVLVLRLLRSITSLY